MSDTVVTDGSNSNRSMTMSELNERIASMVVAKPRKLLFRMVLDTLIQQGVPEADGNKALRKMEQDGLLVHICGKGYEYRDS